jgi:hypothetical protein
MNTIRNSVLRGNDSVEGNALEVGVTSRILCYVAQIVRMYDGAVIIYNLPSLHENANPE